MILQEATIGGTVYLSDLGFDAEANLPEVERVAFVYRAITNRERVDLVYRSRNGLTPNWVDICELAVTSIRNLTKPDGSKLSTVAELLDYPDKDKQLMIMLIAVGNEIWKRQNGDEVALKN